MVGKDYMKLVNNIHKNVESFDTGTMLYLGRKINVEALVVAIVRKNCYGKALAENDVCKYVPFWGTMKASGNDPSKEWAPYSCNL